MRSTLHERADDYFPVARKAEYQLFNNTDKSNSQLTADVFHNFIGKKRWNATINILLIIEGGVASKSGSTTLLKLLPWAG